MGITKYRCGLHETNSSSAHAYVCMSESNLLTKEELYDQIYLTKKSELYLFDVEYGFDRGFRVLTSFSEKLSYVLCEYCGAYFEDEPEFEGTYNALLEIVKEIIPEVTDFHVYKKDVDIYLDDEGNQIFRKDLEYEDYDSENDCCIYSYKDKNGEKKIAKVDKETYLEVPSIGAIDHQSAGMLKHYLESRSISIKEFLLNKRYIIICDGDERCDLDKMIEAKIIDLSKIKEIVR